MALYGLDFAPLESLKNGKNNVSLKGLEKLLVGKGVRTLNIQYHVSGVGGPMFNFLPIILFVFILLSRAEWIEIWVHSKNRVLVGPKKS